MKSVFIEAMNETFDLAAMLTKIDYHHIRGSLTDVEREELIALARSKAHPMGGVDMMSMLQDHERRIKALEDAAHPSDSSTGSGTIPAYQPGKWYYSGDKMTFNGAVYTCVAPTGIVCTWSPEEYPAYWELTA